MVSTQCIFILMTVVNVIYGQSQQAAGPQVRAKKFETSPGRYTNIDPMMLAHGVRSKLQCVAQCDRTDDCMAVNYNKADQVCELINTAELTDAEHVDANDGWVVGSQYTRDDDCVIPPPGSDDPLPPDCLGWYIRGCHTDGVYPISPDDTRPAFNILCDMEEDQGWSVIQRRFNGMERFYDRNWLDYKHGFGNLSQEFWLGNEFIHLLTTSSTYELKVELQTYDEQWHHSLFSDISIENESYNYQLYIGDLLEGDGGFNDGLQFSTYDRDNDYDQANCAGDYNMGGWWFDECNNSDFLNGKYSTDGSLSTTQGLRWINLNGGTGLSLIATVLKVRKVISPGDDYYDYLYYDDGSGSTY